MASLLSGNMRAMLCAASLTFAADQASKALVTSQPLGWCQTIIPELFNLVHVQNRGAAFGFLNRTDIDWQVWLFTAVTIVAAGIILNLVKTAPARSRWLCTSLGLVLGGATGNLLDRLRLHAVTDFLDFQLGAYHWPAFNLADTAICCGAILASIILWKTPTHTPGGNQ